MPAFGSMPSKSRRSDRARAIACIGGAPIMPLQLILTARIAPVPAHAAAALLPTREPTALLPCVGKADSMTQRTSEKLEGLPCKGRCAGALITLHTGSADAYLPCRLAERSTAYDEANPAAGMFACSNAQPCTSSTWSCRLGATCCTVRSCTSRGALWGSRGQSTSDQRLAGPTSSSSSFPLCALQTRSCRGGGNRFSWHQFQIGHNVAAAR